jgi:hypothetical protein
MGPCFASPIRTQPWTNRELKEVLYKLSHNTVHQDTVFQTSFDGCRHQRLDAKSLAMKISRSWREFKFILICELIQVTMLVREVNWLLAYEPQQLFHAK